MTDLIQIISVAVVVVYSILRLFGIPRFRKDGGQASIVARTLLCIAFLLGIAIKLFHLQPIVILLLVCVALCVPDFYIATRKEE